VIKKPVLYPVLCSAVTPCSCHRLGLWRPPQCHSHVAEPPWDSPQTRALAVRACFDCHSNEAVWPWYSNVALASWLIQRDVDDGRRRLSWSEWGVSTPRFERESGAEAMLRSSMPPWFYLPLHPAARLTAAEKQELVAGLQKTFGGR
jgi:hypothetical protein